MTRIISPREDVKLLVVSVPKGAGGFTLLGGLKINAIRYTQMTSPGKFKFPIISIPPGDYLPLGIATEITEEVTRDLVEEVEGFLGSRMFKVVHKTGQISKSNSITFAWHSFLRREGITERVYVLKVKN